MGPTEGSPTDSHKLGFSLVVGIHIKDLGGMGAGKAHFLILNTKQGIIHPTAHRGLMNPEY